MWLWSVSVFLGASVLCGVAWSISSLIIFRLVQRLGSNRHVKVPSRSDPTWSAAAMQTSKQEPTMTGPSHPPQTPIPG
jgi:MFS family permease